MEPRADQLLEKLKDANASLDAKVESLLAIKGDIKQNNVPDNALPPLFDAIKLGISSQYTRYCGAAFSTLGNLVKRLYSQEKQRHIATYARIFFPVLLDRLGDQKERIRIYASQAFVDFWPASPREVEAAVLGTALTGKNPRAKQMAIEWLLTMVRDHGLAFRCYVPDVVRCLENADVSVRDAAKLVLIQIFVDQNDETKAFLKQTLEEEQTRKATHNLILEQIGYAMNTVGPSAAEPTSVERPLSARSVHVPPTQIDVTPLVEQPLPVQRLAHAPPTQSEVAPLVVRSGHQLEDIFTAMAPDFEGRETEKNWNKREKHVIVLRQVVVGNAPGDYPQIFYPQIKAQLDAVFKAVFSLRTTLSSNGCYFFIDMARWLGPNIDGMVEIIIQNLFKVCVVSKKITAQNGNKAVIAVMANVSYSPRLLHHIQHASADKNVQLRLFAAEWLRTIIDRHTSIKAAIEQGNGLNLITTCIKHGLADANPNVREEMRHTYWTFYVAWPTRATHIASDLDSKSQLLLEKSSHKPKEQHPNPSTAEHNTAPAVPEKGRSALKSAIAAQKRVHLKAKAPEVHLRANAPEFHLRANTPEVHLRANAPEEPPAVAGPSILHSAPVRPKLRRPEGGRSEAPKQAKKPPHKESGPIHLERNESPPVITRPPLPNDDPFEGNGTPPVMIRPSVPDDDLFERNGAPPVMIRPSVPNDDLLERNEVYPVLIRPSVPNDDLLERNGAPPMITRPPLPDDDLFAGALLERTEEMSNRRALVSPLPGSQDPNRSQQLLDRGIQLIRSNRMDPHGFRRLRKVLDSGGGAVVSGQQHRELVLALLGALQQGHPSARGSAETALLPLLDVLEHTIRNRNEKEKSEHILTRFSPDMYFLTIQAFLKTRMRFDSSCYFSVRLDEVARTLIQAELDEGTSSSVEAILDTIGEENIRKDQKDAENQKQQKNMIIMGLSLLAEVLRQQNVSGVRLPEDIMKKIGSLAAGQIDAEHAEVRRLVVQVCVHLHSMDKEKFWDFLGTPSTGSRNLLAYYLARG